MSPDLHIIGIAGLVRSGKDTLAELYQKNGYFGVSFGDVIRGFARDRHKGEADPISVANMTETANWLRDTRGADVVLQEALHQFEEKQKTGTKYKGLVLWSIRAPVEADFVLSHHGELIWVEASDEVRYLRTIQNLREGEAQITLEEFKRQEKLQWQPQPGIPAEAQMNIAYVKEHATRVLENNQSGTSAFLREAQSHIDKSSTSTMQ